ncbi:hypothetical protein Caci_0436 [Catenulispora acidiphila DSM 44928]|uniref:vWA-MoxR associated protein C-terminal domain-containing protein n=1 Tax=Catenulispora acidiphila (strain DSM 44928 / JCM 14897 / NBRC 102108 / NRRL B-24433 / ID139908) TaxID=479433 RepID=C7PVN2_CATAD|nr:trypsin-like peptidase domain-containing protein [Catenulispora acidiphila]ACU69388.1 hypothetical protein Caci_0436 [Catenulispora acidiphila DSM 44928]
MALAQLPNPGGPHLIAQAERSAVAVLAPEAPPEPGAEPALCLIGSGFFITTDLVLTCAHVVADEPELYVLSGSVTLRVKAVELIDPPYDGDDSWPVPDLALLRIEPAPPDDESDPYPVWLDLAPNASFISSAGYLSVGYDKRGPGGAAALASRLYDAGGTRKANAPGLPSFTYVELAGNTVPTYRSGSMVIDLSTGRVTGIVKAARAEDDGDGGYAVPLAGVLPRVLSRQLGVQKAKDILAAHDSFHARTVDWPAMCEHYFTGPQPPGAIRADSTKLPLNEVALLGLLVSIRHVVTDAELFEIIQSHSGLELAADAGLRDVALGLAATTTWSSTDVHSLLRFMDGLTTRLEHRVSQQWLAEARKWADGLAAKLNQTSRLRALRMQTSAIRRTSGAAEAGSSSLRVLVDPAFDPAGGYHVSIRMHHSAGVGAEQSPEETIGSASVLAHLRDVLPAAVRAAARLDGGCLIDLVLPLDLLAEPVHKWEVSGSTPLGHLLPVAVRSVERYRDRDDVPGARLREIWDRASKEAVSLQWIMCEDPENTGRAVEHTGLGLVNPPTSRHRRSRRLLDEAVQDGVPLLVWSASDCGVDHADPQNVSVLCAGPYFQGIAEEALRDVVLEDVPHRLFAKRSQAGAEELDAVALFWDNPGLGHEENLLTEPCYPEDS